MNKKIVIPTVIIFTVFVISIMWWQTREMLVPKYTGPVEKITIANLGEYSIFNLIAKEKGYFRENGLDAEIREYQAGPPMIADLLDGKVDVSAAGEFPGVSSMFTNKNLRILAEASKQKSTQIVARKDKGIYTPGDLKGKRIGVTKKSAGEIFLGRFLTFNNLALSDVKIINLSPVDMTNQIINGEIDAVSAYEPNPYNIAKKLGDNAIVWSAQGDQDTYALLYSTDEFIKSYPQIIDRYLQSLAQAEQYVKNNNKEAIDLLVKILHYDDSYVKYYWPKISFSLSLEQALLLTMEDEARWAIANKLTNATMVPNYLDFIYFNALEKIKPEAITMIH